MKTMFNFFIKNSSFFDIKVIKNYKLTYDQILFTIIALSLFLAFITLSIFCYFLEYNMFTPISIIVWGLTWLFLTYILSSYYHDKFIDVYFKTFLKKADLIIKDKSKENLDQEINKLLNNNCFVRKFFHLFKNNKNNFQEEFNKVLYDLNQTYKDKTFIHNDFLPILKNLDEDRNRIAFLLYLNNCSFLLNNKEYNKNKKIHYLKKIKKLVNINKKLINNGNY